MSSGNERLYNWNDRAIRWYCNAVEYRSFHRDVAEMVLKKLPPMPRVCDIGCGTGALAFHLAPFCRSVLGMDLNPRPIACMNEQISRQNIQNVQTVVGDFLCEPLPGEKYDGAVFCLAGGVSSFLARGMRWADRMFFVENATNSRSFSTGESHSKETYFNEDLNFLRDSGIPYDFTFFEAPFGQVFTDMEDAREFMRFYNRDKTEEDIRKTLESRLQKISHPKYSLFMPNTKPLLLITIYNGA